MAKASARARRLVFVVFHEYITGLDFGDHFLFTPHVSRGSMKTWIPVAYFPYSVETDDASLKTVAQRPVRASFRGTIETNRQVRQRLVDQYRGKTGYVIEGSGAFHDVHGEPTRTAHRRRYIELLANTQIALCPAGAGPSTIRFWEALAMRCVPLLISDDLVLPMNHLVEWDRIVLRVPESDISSLENVIRSVSDEELEARSARGFRTWQRFFSNIVWPRTFFRELKRVAPVARSNGFARRSLRVNNENTRTR